MLDYKLAKVFPKPTIYAGYILITLGSFYMLFQVLAILMVAIGVFVSFSYNGIEIKPSEKSFRSYSRIFGLKFGKWEPLEQFKSLSILRREDAYRAYSYAMSSFESKSEYFGIFLLSANHRKKMEVQKHGNKTDALAAAKKLSQDLQLDLVKYQPVISAKTQGRRRPKTT